MIVLLEEFDTQRKAVIEPNLGKRPDFPETIISIFSHELFHSIVTLLNAEPIATTHDVDGVWNIYEAYYKGKRFALYKARLGAPACVSCFEEALSMGGKRVILLGNCGVLDRNIADCGIIIPTHAIRDEGTSYHYAPPSDTIEVNKKYRDTFKKVLERTGYSYTEGMTWSTDAFFRETPAKVQRRKEMGAVCVEMECAAMQAMCDFRGVEFFQFLYAGDNLDNPSWDPRSLAGDAMLEEKEKIALLAFELALAIEEEEKP